MTGEATGELGTTLLSMSAIVLRKSKSTYETICKDKWSVLNGAGLFAFLYDSLWRNYLMLFLIAAAIFATFAFVIIDDNCWPDC